MSSLQEQYSFVRYPHYVHALTDPARLAAIGRILGLTPPGLSCARVLEIGCSAGANLLAMAARMPGNQYVGVDFSAPDIADAQAIVTEAGLANVQFVQADLIAWDPGPQPFDYIIAHGFYSWVPDEVKDRLLQIIATSLSPQGIACVSYMTYPGCAGSQTLRHLMQLRTESPSDPAEQAAKAHQVLDFLDRAWQALPSLPHSSLLHHEARRVLEKPPDFLLHDDLELVRDPVYLHQFVSHATRHGLKYLGDSEFDSTLLVNLPQSVARELLGLRLNSIQTEQVLDYITNRSFRTTLLASPAVHVPDAFSVAALRELCFSPKLQPAGDLKPGAQEAHFTTADGSKVSLRSVPLIAFIRALSTLAGSVTAYAELKDKAQRLAGRPFTEPEETQLTKDLFTLYARRELDISAIPFTALATTPQHPRMSALNLALANRRSMIIPASHSSLRLTEDERSFCLLLDGSRTAQELQQSKAAKPLRDKVDTYLRSLNRLGCLI